MKRFHIVANKDSDPSLKVTGNIEKYLTDHGCTVTGESIIRDDGYGRELSKDAFSAECILVLGGDGTFIQVAGKNTVHSIPMLGINLGYVGYLTEVERDNVIPALDRLINGDYYIEERMMLSGKCLINGIFNSEHALNDIIISRYGSLRVIKYEIYVNDMLLNTYSADGVIISTPTGSTGYNLSAGGPIVEPVAELIVINPICPHTLNTRAIVLSAEDEIRIKVLGGRFLREYEASVSFDGGVNMNLKAGDEVVVKKALVSTKMIRLDKESFLYTLGRKMKG
ncbi:MAG: NAD(+)/NADH kinase [Lachnospiraceae bacterium]|nr:NAD(+)/NADH kinase [Lachnospiraceae bacterium]